MTWIRVVFRKANFYRMVRLDGAAFDTRFLSLESSCTLFAMLMIFAVITISVVWSALQSEVHSHQETEPSLTTYSDIVALGSPPMVGNVNCQCIYPVLAYGKASGGFVTSANHALDGLCRGSSTTGTAPAPDQKYVSLKDLPAAGQTHVWGCGGVQQLNTGLASWNSTLTPWAECAVVQEVSLVILEELKELCETADLLHQKALQSWLLESFLTTTMMTKVHLNQFVRAKLDSLAAGVGFTFRSSERGAKGNALDRSALPFLNFDVVLVVGHPSPRLEKVMDSFVKDF
jgi:hypothetical protein